MWRLGGKVLIDVVLPLRGGPFRSTRWNVSFHESRSISSSSYSPLAVVCTIGMLGLLLGCADRTRELFVVLVAVMYAHTWAVMSVLVLVFTSTRYDLCHSFLSPSGDTGRFDSLPASPCIFLLSLRQSQERYAHDAAHAARKQHTRSPANH